MKKIFANGEEIRKRRTELRMSREQLANKIADNRNVSTQTIGRYENESNKTATLEILEAIAVVLKCEWQDIGYESDKPNNDVTETNECDTVSENNSINEKINKYKQLAVGIIGGVILGGISVFILDRKIITEPTKVIIPIPDVNKVRTSSLQITSPTKSDCIGLVKIAKGTHQLPLYSHVWAVLTDSYGNFYLQNPPVVLNADNTWSVKLSPGSGITGVAIVLANDAAHTTFLQKVDNIEWGAFQLPSGAKILSQVP